MKSQLIAFVSLLCLAAGPARADDFERQLARMGETLVVGARAAIAEVSYPKKIVCEKAPEGSKVRDDLRFYTRLDVVKAQTLPQAPGKLKVATMFDPESDETATKLNEHWGIAANEETLYYDVWSCDTQDYYFTFTMSELAREASSKASTRPITGRLRIETRGKVDFRGEMACTAFY